MALSYEDDYEHVTIKHFDFDLSGSGEMSDFINGTFSS